jgi:hypothetical protein
MPKVEEEKRGENASTQIKSFPMSTFSTIHLLLNEPDPVRHKKTYSFK